MTASIPEADIVHAFHLLAKASLSQAVVEGLLSAEQLSHDSEAELQLYVCLQGADVIY